MYIDSIEVQNFRSVRKTRLDFTHAEYEGTKAFPRARIPNVNLILGNNGCGKTSILRTIALAALGPAVPDSGLRPDRWVRREPTPPKGEVGRLASVKARFRGHRQDGVEDGTPLFSDVSIREIGDLERLTWLGPDEKEWYPVFSAKSDAFFFVGYGPNRRVELRESVDLGSRRSKRFERAQRVSSLFDDTYSLIPLSTWLPELSSTSPGRTEEVLKLFERLAGRGHFRLIDEREGGEYLFQRGKLKVPFPALSDGYRAYFGWVADLVYHVCMTCPPSKRLADNRGVVLVDEIDLHLHPSWQRTVIHTLALALPNVQFIVTSHSPLVAGSLEWMNILHLTPSRNESSVAVRRRMRVHGLDADQVLLTRYFGLDTTRSAGQTRKIHDLTRRARDGDLKAAASLLETLGRGEGSPK
jgi:energy-coupling factor transporter ATP-binding protein EcfA2